MNYLQVPTVLLIILLRSIGMGVTTATPTFPEDGLCAPLVTPKGYKCEELQVTTGDGYILSVQRISSGRSGDNGSDTNVGEKNQPVIVQHGVLVDGSSWLLNEAADENLPCILADNGYDVWVANGRGTILSRKHTTLSSLSTEFWDWSFDEMVTYDLPALFDYVFNETQQKIHYVGHSQGTLIMMASLSEEKLLDKLRSVVLLSPVAFLSHMKTQIAVIAAKSLVGEYTTHLPGIAEFNPRGFGVKQFLERVCFSPRIDCNNMLTAFTGLNCCLKTKTVNAFLQNAPQATANKNLVHFAQIVKEGTLAKYNHGSLIANMNQYGAALPPIYNLSNIPQSMPLFMSYGGRDSLASVKDVENLLDILKFHDVQKIYVEDYAHADFMMAHNAKDLVYNPVVSFIKQH